MADTRQGCQLVAVRNCRKAGAQVDLTGAQKQAVTELLNRAVQHSAAALADVIENGVALSVSCIDLTSHAEASRRLDDGAATRAAVSVRQRFTGSLSGDLLLVFCERQSLVLVRTLLADTVPLEVMTDLEQDALTEVGNVVLNASLGSLATQLGGRLTSALPEYRRGNAARLLNGGDGEVLFVHLDVALGLQDIDGYLIMLLDGESGCRFRDYVDNYLKRA